MIWMMGSFSNAEWWMIKYSLPAVILAGIVIYFLSFKLDVMSLGDEAEYLGIDTSFWRTIFVFLASVLVASVVSFTGMIGWVGWLFHMYQG